MLHFHRELQHKPFDRELLDRFVVQVRGHGTVCDLGCGPGHVAAYLAERAVDVLGIDLSPGMVEQARRLQPQLEFRPGDMTALDLADASLAGIAAFYSIIHVPPPEVPAALGEMFRTLRPGGRLLLSVHLGEEPVHLDEWWSEPVSLDFHMFERAALEQLLSAAGFEIVEVLERAPYPDVEAQTHRAYVFARRPGR